MRGLVILFAILYVAFPIDLIPDFIPVLGFIDDLVIGSGGLAAAILPALMGPKGKR